MIHSSNLLRSKYTKHDISPFTTDVHKIGNLDVRERRTRNEVQPDSPE
jgi:hypothetical protein